MSGATWIVQDNTAELGSGSGPTTIGYTITGEPGSGQPTLTVGHGKTVQVGTIDGVTSDVGLSLVVLGTPPAGTLSLGADGAVEYTAPGSVVAGQTDAFAYLVEYGGREVLATGSETVALDPGPSVTDPVDVLAAGQSIDLSAMLPQLANPGLPGDALTLTSVSVSSGTLTSAGGDIDYTPPSSGAGSIAYSLADQYGDSATGALRFTVDPGPTTQPGSLVVGHGQTADLTGYVRGLVTPGLPGDTLQFVSVSSASGRASLISTKMGTVLDYTAGASGADTVEYSVADRFVSSTSTIVNGGAVTYGENYGTSAPVAGTIDIFVDPGPTTTTASATVQLGQSIDLTKTILAADRPGFKADTLTILSDNAAQTRGQVSLTNGDLSYAARGPGLAGLPANGSDTDSFSYVVADQYGDTAVGTVDVTVANPITVINGGPYGGSTIEGNAGADQITAYGYNNTIFDNGGDDVVSAGQGQATVHGGGGNVTVALSGYNNAVSGGDGADSVSGSQGNTAVSLGNGADLVQLGGYNNAVFLGDGDDTVSAGAGSETVAVGNGNDRISAGGYGNRITVGSGNDTILAGAGNATVSGGGGSDAVQLQGFSNSVSLTGGDDTINGGAGSDVFLLTGGNASLALQGSNEMVFLDGANASISDHGSGLRIAVAHGGADVISNFAADPSAVVDLVGGLGGYASAAQAVAALTPDGHGGSLLALGNAGSIDFAGVSLGQLHASNFQIS